MPRMITASPTHKLKLPDWYTIQSGSPFYDVCMDLNTKFYRGYGSIEGVYPVSLGDGMMEKRHALLAEEE